MNEPSGPRIAPGIAAGLLLSVPAALRCAPGWPTLGCVVYSQRPLAAGALMWAAVSLVVVPVGLWIRRAALKDPRSVDRALLLGTALSALPLALFGGVLKSTTHHRPLGGATFAVVASLVLACCIGLALRVRGSGSSSGSTRPAWLSHFFSVCCSLSLVGAVVLARNSAQTWLDFVTLALACAGAGLLKIPKALARIPGPAVALAWGLLVVVGLVLTRDRDLMRNLQERAPISFVALSWLGDGS